MKEVHTIPQIQEFLAHNSVPSLGEASKMKDPSARGETRKLKLVSGFNRIFNTPLLMAPKKLKGTSTMSVTWKLVFGMNNSVHNP